MNLPMLIIVCIPLVCVVVVVAAVKRKVPVWAAIVIVIALLFFHGFLGGLPGFVGETVFQHTLKVGSSRADVITLERRLGGEDRVPGWSLQGTKGAPGVVGVQFSDYTALYGTSGKAFSLEFGPDWRLESWKVERWASFL